jgi:hypothetical protein
MYHMCMLRHKCVRDNRSQPACDDDDDVAPRAGISRPSPIAHHPSPIAHRPSPIAHRPSPIAHRPSSIAHRAGSRHPTPSVGSGSGFGSGAGSGSGSSTTVSISPYESARARAREKEKQTFIVPPVLPCPLLALEGQGRQWPPASAPSQGFDDRGRAHPHHHRLRARTRACIVWARARTKQVEFNTRPLFFWSCIVAR